MAHIKVKTAKEIELIRDAGALTAETLQRAGELCKPGVATIEIDNFIGDYIKKHGGVSADLGYYGYPRQACISINEVVCHGIPDAKTILKDGDIVNIDITVILSGYHGDASEMFLVGNVSKSARELVSTTKFCMEEGIRVCGLPNAHYADIGSVIQDIADEHGYGVVEDYCGHGIGRGFHEDPTVFHFRYNGYTPRIEEGHVFTIEPMINEGKPGVRVLGDKWTVVTKDGSLSAQWEHTIALTKNGIEILTLPR